MTDYQSPAITLCCLGRWITIPSISSVIIRNLGRGLFSKNAQITAHYSPYKAKPKELDSVCVGKVSTKCLKKEMELELEILLTISCNPYPLPYCT